MSMIPSSPIVDRCDGPKSSPKGRWDEFAFLGLRDGQILHRGQPIHVDSAIVRSACFLLAMHRDGLPTDRFIKMMWPDADADSAHSLYLSTLYRVRRALGADPIIRQLSPTRTLLNPMLGVFNDVVEFERLANMAFIHPGSYLEARRLALALYRSDFLPSCDLPWSCELRERLRGLFTALQSSAEKPPSPCLAGIEAQVS